MLWVDCLFRVTLENFIRSLTSANNCTSLCIAGGGRVTVYYGPRVRVFIKLLTFTAQRRTQRSAMTTNGIFNMT